jgi:hypothetical protein
MLICVPCVSLDMDDISESRVVGRVRVGAVFIFGGDLGAVGESSRGSQGVGDLV